MAACEWAMFAALGLIAVIMIIALWMEADTQPCINRGYSEETCIHYLTK